MEKRTKIIVKAVVLFSMVVFLGTLLTSCSIVKEFKSPIALIKVSPLSGFVPLMLTFDGSDSYDPDGHIVEYKWNFGDGQAASGTTISHTYEQEGSYIVSLTVTDDDGRSGTQSVTVTAIRPPPAGSFFQISSVNIPSSGTVGTSVPIQFTITNIGNQGANGSYQIRANSDLLTSGTLTLAVQQSRIITYANTFSTAGTFLLEITTYSDGGKPLSLDDTRTQTLIQTPVQVEGNLVLVNFGTDQVGRGTDGNPNGEPDAHFKLTVPGQGQHTVNSIRMTTSDAQGNVEGIWDTISRSAPWTIGVFRNGKRLNPNDIDLLDSITGTVQYDLYVNGDWYFKSGRTVVVVVNYAEGGEFKASLVIK